MNNFFVIWLIPPLFAAIHALEFAGTTARIAGIHKASPLTAYSIQNAVYMATRLLFVLMLPILGLAVDVGTSSKHFLMVSHGALCAASTSSIIVYIFRGRLTKYYCSVIDRYNSGKGFVSSFISKTVSGEKYKLDSYESVDLGKGYDSIIFKSAAVYTFYSVGVFIAFFTSTLIPEYRASLGQMSGVINAGGAVILTFFIEPRISRAIDQQEEDSLRLLNGLLMGRLFAVTFLSQIALLSLWLFI